MCILVSTCAISVGEMLTGEDSLGFNVYGLMMQRGKVTVNGL